MGPSTWERGQDPCTESYKVKGYFRITIVVVLVAFLPVLKEDICFLIQSPSLLLLGSISSTLLGPCSVIFSSILPYFPPCSTDSFLTG